MSGVRSSIHQRGKALRVVLVGFGDRGKAPHVAKQDGHLAFFPAQHKFFRGLRQLLDKFWSKVLAEGAADLAALSLRSIVRVQGDARRQEAEDKRRI